MSDLKRPTEQIAREQIHGLTEELHAITTPMQDGNLAAWERAEAICRELAMTCQEVQRAIQARPMDHPGRLERMGLFDEADKLRNIERAAGFGGGL